MKAKQTFGLKSFGFQKKAILFLIFSGSKQTNSANISGAKQVFGKNFEIHSSFLSKPLKNLCCVHE